MTASDPLDDEIRGALARVVSRAPLAPDFDDITSRPTRSIRNYRVVAAAVVLVVVAVAAAALAGGGDGSVSTTATAPEPAGPTVPGSLDPNLEVTATCRIEDDTALFEPGTNVVVDVEIDLPVTQRATVRDALTEMPSIVVLRYVDQFDAYSAFVGAFGNREQLSTAVTPRHLTSRLELRVEAETPIEVVTETVQGLGGVQGVRSRDEVVTGLEQACERRDPIPVAGPDGEQIGYFDPGAPKSIEVNGRTLPVRRVVDEDGTLVGYLGCTFLPIEVVEDPDFEPSDACSTVTTIERGG